MQGFYILHEGLIGVVDDGLEEISYSNAVDDAPATFKSENGWLGITDKYWATVVIPEQGKPFDAKFAGTQNGDAHALPDRLSDGAADGRSRAARRKCQATCSPAPRKSTSSTAMRRPTTSPNSTS